MAAKHISSLDEMKLKSLNFNDPNAFGVPGQIKPMDNHQKIMDEIATRGGYAKSPPGLFSTMGSICKIITALFQETSETLLELLSNKKLWLI